MSATQSGRDGGRRNSKTILTYIALAFAIAWIAWIPLIKLGADEAFLNIGAAGPAIAALLLSRSGQRTGRTAAAWWMWWAVLLLPCWLLLTLYYANRGVEHLVLDFNPWLLIPAAVPAGILASAASSDVGVKEFARRLVHWPTRWTWFALLAFPVFQVVPAAIMGVLKQPLVWPSQHGPIAVLVACGLLFFAYNVVFVGAEEEPGWRGFLLDRLQGRFSPLVASLLVWLPWALWHGPLDYFRPVRFTLVFWLLLRVVTLIPLTIIITWFYNRSGRSIQATVMFHASMNTAPMVLPYSQTAMALLFVWAAWVVIAGRMWRKNSEIRGQGLLPLNPDI